jgi:HSP20 family molecular chaperone IbpA
VSAMNIRPPAALAPRSPDPKSRSSSGVLREGENVEQKRAQAAEKEAQRRIQEAEERVRESQRASEHEIDGMREEYSDRMDAERSRQEGHLISEKNEGNQRIAELKHKQQEELNGIRREGDRQLDDLQRHYRETTYRNFRDGEKSLKEQQSRNAMAQEYDLQSATASQEKARQNQDLQMQMLKDRHERQTRDLNHSYRTELDRSKERTEEAKMEADEAFSKSFEDLSSRQQKLISDLDARTSRQLSTLRDANALRLAAYDARSEDEFYRLRHMDASLEENDDSYIVRAQIPEHERKNLAVSVQGSVVTLTNQRRNQEEQQLEPGRRQATSSYQIITESFPLPLPVDPRSVRREFDGDTFIVTIPKKSTYAATSQMAGQRSKKAPHTIEKLKAERPKFPENLPLNQPEIDRQVAESRLPNAKVQLAGDLPGGGGRSRSRGVPGGGTLT